MTIEENKGFVIMIYLLSTTYYVPVEMSEYMYVEPESIGHCIKKRGSSTRNV